MCNIGFYLHAITIAVKIFNSRCMKMSINHTELFKKKLEILRLSHTRLKNGLFLMFWIKFLPCNKILKIKVKIGISLLKKGKSCWEWTKSCKFLLTKDFSFFCNQLASQARSIKLKWYRERLIKFQIFFSSSWFDFFIWIYSGLFTVNWNEKKNTKIKNNKN